MKIFPLKLRGVGAAAIVAPLFRSGVCYLCEKIVKAGKQALFFSSEHNISQESTWCCLNCGEKE